MLLSLSKPDTKGLKLFKFYVFILKTLKILRKTSLFQKEILFPFTNKVSHLNSQLSRTLMVVNQLIRISSYLLVLLQEKQREAQS